jgi:hypothetical protein
MDSSPLVSIGRSIISLAHLIGAYSWYLYGALFAVVALLLVLRFLTEALRLNPFGRFAYYTARPANNLLRNVRSSRFYYPLKRALSFDPAFLMVVIGTAIVCYVIYLIVSYLLNVLIGLGGSLSAFGSGEWFQGVRYLIGTVLLAVIFYLLALMLLVFVNWMFGLFSRAAYRALDRIAPLLRIFEFGGVFAGWSFLILGIALSFAASAVQFIFFS